MKPILAFCPHNPSIVGILVVAPNPVLNTRVVLRTCDIQMNEQTYRPIREQSCVVIAVEVRDNLNIQGPQQNV